MKYVYGEGVISRSKRNPRVQSGALARRQPTVYREAWVPWKFYSAKIVDGWLGWIARHVPGTKGLIFEVYERRFYPLFTPEERETIAYINWSKMRPDRRARWRVYGDEEVSPSRSEPEG